MNQSLFIVYYDLGLGGVQGKIVDIVNFLSKKQSSLRIYVLLRKKSEFNLGLKIKNKKAKIVYYTDWLNIRIPFFFPVFVFYQVWKLRPISILTFSDASSLSAIWAKLLLSKRKIKVVVSEDRYVPREVAAYRFAPLRHFLIKSFYRFADVIFSPNQAMAKDLAKACGLPIKKVKIVDNWTNLVQRKISQKQKKYDLIYVGRLAKVKNIKFLLKAVKKLKEDKRNIRLCLVGEGEEKRSLKAQVKDDYLTKNIMFVGPQYKVENYLSQAKIFVLPSKAEGLPLVVLEAMAMGVPVMSAKYPGVKEVIKDGETGFIYKNSTEFVEKALVLLQDSVKRGEISRKAKAYVELYHSPENINQYLEALGIK